MDICQRGMKMLLEFEGKHKKISDGRYKAYKCPAGVWTIYAGLTRGVREGMIVTEADGDKMLLKELATYEDAVERLVKVPLNQNQFSALTLFVYNVGIGAFTKSTLLKKLNRGQYQAVPAELSKWVKGGGKTLPGLVRRRAAEGALFVEPMPKVRVPEADDDEDDEDDDLTPQAVEIAAPSVGAVVKESRTIQASIGAIGLTFVQIWNWLFGAVKEAGPDVVSNTQALTPFQGLLGYMGANMGLLAAIVTLGTLAVVIQRRLASERA